MKIKFLFSVLKEHLKVRQVLAQPRPKEDSFTAMVANLGRPKATSSVRRKSSAGNSAVKSRASSTRFVVDSSGSEEAVLTTPVKGKSKSRTCLVFLWLDDSS